MHRLVLAVSASMVLASCGKAEAIAPNPSNPAHCIAAFNYGTYWFSVAPRNSEKIARMMAQAKYEAIKIKSSGRSLSEAEAEGAALTKAYAKDGKEMNRLMLACGIAQAHDAEFRKQFPSLLEWARKAEPSFYPVKP